MTNEQHSDLETQKSIAYWMLHKQLELLLLDDSSRTLADSIHNCINHIVSACDKQVELMSVELAKKTEHAKALEKMILEKVKSGKVSQAAIDELGAGK